MNGYVEHLGVAAGAEAAPTGAAVICTTPPSCTPADVLSQQYLYGASVPVITSHQASLQSTSNPAVAVQQPLSFTTVQQLHIIRPSNHCKEPLQEHQQQQEGQCTFTADDDAALLELLDSFEQEQSQQRDSLLRGGRRGSSSPERFAEANRCFDSSLRTQYTAAAQLVGHQGQVTQLRQTVDTQQPAASMSAAYPYQDVYSQQQQQQLNTLAQHYQQPQYSTQMYHPGVAIAYDYNTYAYQQQLLQHPLQQVPQQQLAAQQANHQQQIGQHGQQQFGQPDQWQNMLQQQGMQLPPIMQQHPWAAGAPIQYPETVLNYAPELPVEQFLAANTGAMANGLSAHSAHPAVEFPHATEPASRAKGRATRKSSRAAAAAGRSALGNSAVNVSNNTPEQYFRRHVALVDPFWASATSDDVGMIAVTHLPPAASASTGAAAAVMHSTLSLNLTSSQLILLKSKTAVLQLVCLQVNDKVPHRCHWPCSAIVTVNGQTIRGLFAAKRTPGAQLKQQQVDNLADISTHAAASTVVRLSYTSNSNGYVLGARLVRKQCLALVKQMMAPELDLARAVSEIQMKLAGDGDVEVCVNAVSLRCPLTAMRIKTPAHFITAPGLAYFDLDPFLELAQRSGKWQDPHSSALGDVTQIAYEPWLAAILHELEGAGLADSVEEVEVNPDGCWRPKGAVSDTWFSVLLPPSHAELQMAFKGPSGACVKRKRASEEGDEAADIQQRAKQQRSTAGVSGTGANVVQGDRGCVDLTFDSDEGDEAPAAVKQGSAVNRSSTAAAAGLLSRRGQSVSGAAAASDSKNGTAPAASPRHGHRVSAAQHKQQRSGGEGSQALVSTSRQAGGLPNATTHKPAVQGQQQQQRAGNGRSSAAVRTDAPSAVVDVIVIEDSDSD